MTFSRQHPSQRTPYHTDSCAQKHRYKALWLLGVVALLPAKPLGASQSGRTLVPIRITLPAHTSPVSTFMGLGIEFDPYSDSPSPQRWHTILGRVAWVNPGFLRVMSGAEDYCTGFAPSGKPVYVWQHPTPETVRRLKRLLAILNFAQAHHISVYLGEWSPPRSLGIQRPDDPRWPRMIADFVEYLVRTQHYTVIRHYIFFNEPNGQWMWPHARPDFREWSAGIRELRRDLDARGLRDVVLAGPDNSGNPEWFSRTVRSLNKEFGVWEIHIYATDEQVFGDWIEKDLDAARQVISNNDPDGGAKPRFIAESGLVSGKIESLDQQPRVRTFAYGVEMADYVAQVARAGWMGADAWDLDDAMHGNGRGGFKIWGFWDSSTSEGMTIRPWFYTWALMSRLFPRGCEIIPVRSDRVVPRFRIVANRWRSPEGWESTIMLVNDSTAPQTLYLSLPVQRGRRLYIYRYFSELRPTDREGMPIPSNAMTLPHDSRQLRLQMPCRGVIFVTTATL